MRDGIIYDCPNANCRTPIDTGKCSKACIERYNKAMGIKSKTNADRIRAMSDEELAKECVRQFPMYLWPTEVRTIYFDFENHNKNNAINAWLEWLKQPADMRGEEDG